MRYIKIIAPAVIVIFMITLQSCKKGFLEGVNNDPNYPYQVTDRVLLPGAEGNLAYAQGGDMERFTSLMVQYITGYSRQFAAYQVYTINESDVNNLWNNLYAATMSNYKAMMDISSKEPTFYNTYDAIARILMAYTLGMTTDVWGDLPYSEAFQGNLNLTPAYESQQVIYDSIEELLSTAINELNAEPGDDVDVPDANDFIYGGDPTQWVALAHALKARYYIHQTAIDGSANGSASAQKALDEINAGGDIADAAYPFSSSQHGPWYQYIEQRDDITYSAEEDGVGTTVSNLMSSRSDPRYGVYYDVNGDYWGVGYLGQFFSGDAASVYLMTYFEEAFIESEANLRLGNTADAQTTLQEAINASFTFYGLNPADSAEQAYVSTYGVLTGDFNSDLKTIITEKYIANFLHPETWVDFRRTGYPALVPNSGDQIPLRFVYPQNEHLYNPQPSLPSGGNNTSSTLFSPKLWWEP